MHFRVRVRVRVRNRVGVRVRVRVAGTRVPKCHARRVPATQGSGLLVRGKLGSGTGSMPATRGKGPFIGVGSASGIRPGVGEEVGVWFPGSVKQNAFKVFDSI